MTKLQKPPISDALPVFNFPSYEEYKTINGIKVTLIPDATQPLISIKLFIQQGSIEDSFSGESYCSAQLLTRGTKTYQAERFALEIDNLGASFNSVSNWDDSVISVLTQSAYFRKAFKLLREAFFFPTFKLNEIDRFKKKHFATLEHENSDPDYLVSILFNKAIYGKHAYGKPLIGTQDTIGKFTQQNCLDWHNKLIRKPNLNIVVSGLFDRDKIIESIDHNFGLWMSDIELPIKKELTKSSPTQKLFIENKSDGGQVVLKVGKRSLSAKDPDYPAYQLANTIFGGFFMSRLNKLLREKLGYTYGVYSALSIRQKASAFFINGSFNKNTIADTLQKIVEEMNKFANNRVTEEEFFSARRHVLGSFARSVETPQQVSEFFHTIILHNLDKDYLNKYYELITHIDSDRLFEVQKKYFTPDGLITAAVGDEEFLRKELGFFEK